MNQFYSILLIAVLLSCGTDEELEPFKEGEIHQLSQDDRYYLTLPAYSVPEGEVVFMNKTELRNNWSYLDFWQGIDHSFVSEIQHMIPDYYIHSDFIPVTGSFDIFLYPAEIHFEIPIDFAWDPENPEPNSARYFNFSDLFMYKIPILPNHHSIKESVLSATEWTPISINWKDTLIEDYTEPFVTGYAEILDLNYVYVVARKLY